MAAPEIAEYEDRLNQAIKRHDLSVIKELVDELDRTSDPALHALAERGRGNIAYHRGEFPAALRHFHEALRVLTELDNVRGIADVCASIGNTHVQIGETETALSFYERCATIREEMRDAAGLASVQHNMAHIFFARGDVRGAIELYQRAVEQGERSGDRLIMAMALQNLGRAYAAVADYERSFESLRRGLAISEQLANSHMIMANLSGLGNVFTQFAEYEQALTYQSRALALSEQLGDKAAIARHLIGMATVHIRIRDIERGRYELLRALEIGEETGNHVLRSAVLNNLGHIEAEAERYDDALAWFRRSLSIAEEIRSQEQQCHALINVCRMLIHTGQLDEAERVLVRIDSMYSDATPALRLLEECRSDLLSARGDLDAAYATLSAALQHPVVQQQPEDQAALHLSLRACCERRSDLAGYIAHNERYQAITERIRGADTARRLAVQEKDREIEAREQEHLRHLAVLYSTLPRSIADRVARGERVMDEFRLAGILFLDIVGFTTISAGVSPVRMAQMLEQVFSVCDEIVERHGITKVKTIGDSYMAAGLPQRPDAVHQAEVMMNHLAAAACEILTAISSIEAPDGQPLQVRIGIHAGPVVAGVLGKERLQYDVWGDTVNVASRMESHGEPGRIHVSEAFATALLSEGGGQRAEGKRNDSMTNDSMTLHKRGVIDIKGKGPMTTFWLEGA